MPEHECSGDCKHCAHAAEEQADAIDCRIRHNLAGVKNAVVVLSGKGGVGKSTVAANLAAALALAGRKVGLLDVDVHGPSTVEMLGLRGTPLMATEDGRIQPADASGVKTMSVGLAVDDPDAAIVWRGPMKLGVIQQFLSQVDWGELDYLIVDAPPGTGDEPLTVCQSLPDPLGAIVVTTPQRVAAADVSRSLAFCVRLPALRREGRDLLLRRRRRAREEIRRSDPRPHPARSRGLRLGRRRRPLHALGRRLARRPGLRADRRRAREGRRGATGPGRKIAAAPHAKPKPRAARAALAHVAGFW